MLLDFSPLEQTDLEAIGDYIVQDSPGNATRFVESLREQCEKITRVLMTYLVR